MHQEDAKFEQAISAMKLVIKSIDWRSLPENKNLLQNDLDVRSAMAYAMFECLIDGVDDDKADKWCDFLNGAMQDVTFRHLMYLGNELRVIRPWEAMSFGAAVGALKLGKRVARAGWNGAGQFVYLVPAASYPAQTGIAKAYFGADALVPYRAYLALKTAQGDVSTWAPSCSDALAEDWQIVE